MILGDNVTIVLLMLIAVSAAAVDPTRPTGLNPTGDALATPLNVLPVRCSWY